MSYHHIFKVNETSHCEDDGCCDIVETKGKPVGKAAKKSGSNGSTTKERKEIDDSRKFSKEIATLQYGLLTREREVAKRAEARGLDATEETDRSKRFVQTISKLSEVYAMVDNEIMTTLKKTSWKRLCKSYRSKFVKEYVSKCANLTRDQKKIVLAHIKKIGVENIEGVEYNMDEMRIGKLNIAIDGVGNV